MKPKTGRAPRSSSAATVLVAIRLTVAEDRALRAFAAAKKLSVSAYIRSKLFKESHEASLPEKARERSPAADLPAVLEAIRLDAQRLNLGGLAETACVARSLKMPVERFHAALLLGQQQRVLELRPDSSPDLLTPEDAALCLKGPRGAPLSFVSLCARSGTD